MLSKAKYNIAGKIILVLPLLCICSCEKEDTSNEKYIIETTSDYRILKLTHILENNVVEFERSYIYSDNSVEIYDNGNLYATYYLNSSGLAVSLNEIEKIKYHYNEDNYLVSEENATSRIFYEYSGGNRVLFIWGTNKIFYEYCSLKNYIDIHSFHGTYLGKLNENLIKSYRMQFMMASNGQITTNNYTLDPSGLVTRRVAVTEYYSGASPKTLITDFEYVIHK